MRGPRAAATMTQQQIADLMGLSKTRVYQIEKQAMKKLRRGLLEDPLIREALESNGFAVAAPEEGD